MSLDLQDLVLIIGLTSIITTAGQIPMLYRFKTSLCNEIKDLAIRLGVVEKLEGK